MRKFSLFIVAVLVAPILAAAQATAIPDEMIIAANCITAQAILGRIEKADIGTRLNRTSQYDRLLSLMFAMNARLAANQIAAPDLAIITEEFKNAVAGFRSDFDIYDDGLSRAISADCVNNPTHFYNSLEEARALRTILHENVIKLKQLADNYRDVFGTITKDLP